MIFSSLQGSRSAGSGDRCPSMRSRTGKAKRTGALKINFSANAPYIPDSFDMQQMRCGGRLGDAGTRNDVRRYCPVTSKGSLLRHREAMWPCRFRGKSVVRRTVLEDRV